MHDIGKAKSISTVFKSQKINNYQVYFGILFLIFVLLMSIPLYMISSKLAFYWLSGIAFGFVLQKSRFCFTASMRDPYLTGRTSMSKAVLILFAITTIGFAVVKYIAYLKGTAIPGQLSLAPVSLATVIGAFMFGIGMVVSGGCASGTLMRVGEGFFVQALTLFFFIVGALWGAHDFDWWNNSIISYGRTIFLPDIFGWAIAVIVQLLLIGLLYFLAYYWEKRKDSSY